MKTFQTREQMLAARSIKDRALLQSIANRPARISTSRVNGGVKIVIINPTPEMRAVMDAHGFAPEVDLSYTYARLCATPKDLTVVQNAVRAFFGR